MKQQQPVKRRVRFRHRFFSMILMIIISVLVVYLVWYQKRNQLPSLHGWASSDVLIFARDNDIEIVFEFVYSDTVSPSLVSGQSVQPGTIINDDMVVVVEISKGIQVR
jgi:beta-lactam-binding protein with PASTA domain